MINNYEIKKENNEEILCLYLDFNNEFASFDFNGETEGFKEMIKKYILKNKINFKGKKVAIIVGGVVMATLLITSPVLLQQKNEPIIVEKIEENINDVVIEDNQEEIENKEPVKEDVKVEQITQNTQKEETKVEQTNKKPQKQEQNTKPVYKEETKKTYVTIYRSSGTVLTLELEEYLIGVVGAEMPASFHDEALKAQAIIARSYALHAVRNNKVLTDTSSTQNYNDTTQLKKKWGSQYEYYYNRVKKAVENTKGKYLTYNNQVIQAFYHSTSNGYTEASKNVWGGDYPYLVSVESPYDNTNKSFVKEKFLTYKDLSSKLNDNINSETEFKITSYTEGRRVANIKINGKNYTGVKIRNLLGLRSADFEIEKTSEGINFTTKGYGHGVGLSQYGANGMAKNGYTCEQILKHYYQGITISRLS